MELEKSNEARIVDSVSLRWKVPRKTSTGGGGGAAATAKGSSSGFDFEVTGKRNHDGGEDDCKKENPSRDRMIFMISHSGSERIFVRHPATFKKCSKMFADGSTRKAPGTRRQDDTAVRHEPRHPQCCWCGHYTHFQAFVQIGGGPSAPGIASSLAGRYSPSGEILVQLFTGTSPAFNFLGDWQPVAVLRRAARWGPGVKDAKRGKDALRISSSSKLKNRRIFACNSRPAAVIVLGTVCRSSTERRQPQ